MDAKQFQKEIVDRTLYAMNLYSKEASQLIMGVVWQESGKCKYLVQLGDGPALGFIQMEPATHDDIWKNYLAYKKDRAEYVRGLALGEDVDEDTIPNYMSLRDSLPYQIAMCRCHFLRVSDPLPKAGDVEGMGAYWKKFYNTEKGKGTVEEFVKNFPTEIL